MRICSFLPSTTEIVYELGLGDKLVGVTHECDYPPEVREKRRVIMSFINPEVLSSKEIDDLVTKNAKEGKSTYLVDKDKLKEANPDLILTQGLCDVCAVSGKNVLEAVDVLGHEPEILSLEPHTLDDVLDTITRIGEVTHTREIAEQIVLKLRNRIENIRSLFENEKDRPRVFCLEWLDPPYVAGHWVPEMVEITGGDSGLGRKGKPSFKVSWKEISEYAPHILIIMPCGFNIEKTLNEIDTLFSIDYWHNIPAQRKGHVYLVDANSFFSRPGPRLVDGLEILAKLIHPESYKLDTHPDHVLNLRNHMYFESFL